MDAGPAQRQASWRDGLEARSSRLCAQVAAGRAGARSLRIAHPLLSARRGMGQGGGGALGLQVELTAGPGIARTATVPGGAPPVRCASAELPFVDGAFRQVLLYHVIADGGEAELEEACRVLAPGGDLLIVGLNRWSRAGFDARAAGLPRLQAMKVRARLFALDMVIEGHLGAGVFGRPFPDVIERGWRRVALPLADILLLHARHRIQPFASRPKLRNVPAGLAPTAIAGR